MEPVLDKKCIVSPNLGLAIVSFAAFLGIMIMNRISVMAIEAVDDFSIGIPFIFISLYMKYLEKWPRFNHLIFNTINLIISLIGSFFCLLGLQKCFALVSDKASNNILIFIVIIFILILATGIYETITKDQNN